MHDLNSTISGLQCFSGEKVSTCIVLFMYVLYSVSLKLFQKIPYPLYPSNPIAALQSASAADPINCVLGISIYSEFISYSIIHHKFSQIIQITVEKII